MLHPDFDKYDVTVMLDTDMFVVKGVEKNIFDENGVGIFTPRIERNAYARCLRKYPDRSSPNHQFWGGAIWRLTTPLRQALRKHINLDVMRVFNANLEDEGMVHYLATRANIKRNKSLVLDHKWCYCSYLPNVEKSYMIHIRPKIKQGGPTRPKIETLAELKKNGIVE